MTRRRVTALAAGLCMLAVGGASAADRYTMPPPGYHPDLSTDEAGLWMQVDKAETDIKNSPTLVHDEKLNTYVRGLVCELAGDFCPSIRVYVVENPQFNAFAMPNGAVVVYTGLLLQCENEAQLAFVLGHEITHYLHRHTLAHLRMMVNTTGFLAVFGLAAAGAGVGFLGALANGAGVGAIFRNSRDEERDADANGFRLATAFGYEPAQASAIWRFMADQEGARPKGSPSLFLADHPQSKERMATMEKAASVAEPARNDWKVNADTFHAATAGFIARWSEDELSLNRPDESILIFRRLAANNPSEGLYRYALGESYRRRNGKTDGAAAQEAFRGALDCPDAPAESWRGLGLLAMKAGDKVTARDAFSHYRTALPGAGDKAMIDFYMSQL